ncbi:type VII secretion-associated serine protease mycosin [Actinoplanes sp. NPDC051411]|uniref:type VII secretion-associated serine protease mycosin n=1 Tax=Actinoplanes sp. NPDC051411 TaxID=3155522 RepID=UPI00341E88EF
MVGRRAAAAVAVVFALLLLPSPPAAYAEHVCDQPPPAGQQLAGTPFANQLYAPSQLATLATGAGVRVAVIDSGVDADTPALRGRVAAGADFLHHDPDGRQDCNGHGTEVASLIAGRPVGDSGFQGLAPGATIVPVRVTEEEDDQGGGTSGDHASFADFADAIDWAVGEGRADVINLSLVTTEGDTPVRAAVARAVDKGVVVVAAAGNHGRPGDPNPTPFPAAYPGVIGVGSVNSSGVRSDFSQHGDYVDVVAAGEGVTAAAPGGGLDLGSGTSFAAPFVAATAALIRQRFPDATPAEVARRIEATTDPAPGGPVSAGPGDDAARNPEYGFGLLNPYRALTETLGPASPAAPVAEMMPVQDPAAAARAARRADARRASLWMAVGGLGVVFVIGAAAVVVRQGRRRGWTPAVPVSRVPAEPERHLDRPGEPLIR